MTEKLYKIKPLLWISSSPDKFSCRVSHGIFEITRSIAGYCKLDYMPYCSGCRRAEAAILVRRDNNVFEDWARDLLDYAYRIHVSALLTDLE